MTFGKNLVDHKRQEYNVKCNVPVWLMSVFLWISPGHGTTGQEHGGTEQERTEELCHHQGQGLTCDPYSHNLPTLATKTSLAVAKLWLGELRLNSWPNFERWSWALFYRRPTRFSQDSHWPVLRWCRENINIVLTLLSFLVPKADQSSDPVGKPQVNLNVFAWLLDYLVYPLLVSKCQWFLFQRKSHFVEDKAAVIDTAIDLFKADHTKKQLSRDKVRHSELQCRKLCL